MPDTGGRKALRSPLKICGPGLPRLAPTPGTKWHMPHTRFVRLRLGATRDVRFARWSLESGACYPLRYPEHFSASD
jgi:hypothetical protein